MSAALAQEAPVMPLPTVRKVDEIEPLFYAGLKALQEFNWHLRRSGLSHDVDRVPEETPSRVLAAALYTLADDITGWAEEALKEASEIRRAARECRFLQLERESN
jgi:hypothetical protein